MKKRNMRQIELVGKGRLVTLKHGHAFNVKPGFLIVKTYRNTYVVTFINDCSARLYQGTAGGGIVRVDIDPREFARRFNIAENFMWETIVPKMRERIWEWDSLDAMLSSSMAVAVDAVKKYSIDALCDEPEYLILDSVGDKGDKSYSCFCFTGTRGVYEHRTIPAVFNEDGFYDCEGFVVLTKSRLENLRKAEARLLHAEENQDDELTIDIKYSEFFAEQSSEGFLYKNQESFDDYKFINVPMWRKPVEKLPPHWWRETWDDDTEE